MGKNKIMVGVVNYGAGNLGNVLRALSKLNLAHSMLDNPQDASANDPALLLLPGVGAFPPAMERLVSSGWADCLEDWAKMGRPILGICLGTQLLCTRSSENTTMDGLGLIDGSVDILSGVSKIPHMGWNTVEWNDRAGEIADPGRSFYFIHSFAVSDSPHCIGTTDVDGVVFCSVLRNENVAGFQFHPERSGREGVEFLGRTINFLSGKYS